jgi:hypothetical protein
MYHSVTFGDKNTWDDWHLIPTSQPVILPPAVKSKYVDIPGADGEIDLSTLLSGRPVFSNRTGSLEFIVDNDHESWEVAYSNIANYLHGKRMRVILEDDPVFFYEGRIAVNEWRSNRNFATITLDYVFDPFKKAVNSSVDDWEWDSFDFENGYIQDLRNMEVDGPDSLTVDIIGYPQPIVPTFFTNAELSVKFKDSIYQLPVGMSKVPSILIESGTNTLIFSGTGTVTVYYRGGSL